MTMNWSLILSLTIQVDNLGDKESLQLYKDEFE